MSDTTYVDYVAPAVNAEWLNEINDHVWHDTPVNGATVHMASTIAVTPFDDIAATDVQAALNEINDKIPQSDPIDASKVSYTPKGTGAVTTTVQSKLRESVSVKDFGAVGDGVTDDTAAIQAAINVGKAVYFPSGHTFLISTVTLLENTMLYGEGISSIIKQKVGGTFAMIAADSGSSDIADNITGISLRDLQLRGTVDVDGFSEFSYLLGLNGVSDVSIDNVMFKGFRGDGFYLGSSFTAGVERHNVNVTVQNCTFDGINNANRNGISVIDGDTVVIVNNYFTNCTKSGMPGPIDIEPNSDAFARINNITIRNNVFSSTCGGAADIHFYLPKAFGNPGAPHYAMTTPPDNFLIDGNHHDLRSGGGYSLVITLLNNEIGHVARLWKPNNVRIVNNSFKAAVAIQGTRGVVVSNNVFSGTAVMVVGSDTLNIGKALDTLISGNLFTDTGRGYGATAIGNSSGTQVRGNTYVNIAVAEVNKYGIVLFGSAGTTASDDLIISDNKFYGTFTAHIQWNGAHAYSPSSTVVYGNNGVASDSGNSVVISLAHGYRQNYAIINEFKYTTATLPSAFPIGETICLANGDAGLPSTFKQGTLKTTIVNADPGYRPFFVQQFCPANNDATTLKDLYFRKGLVGIDAWSSWVKTTGV